MNAPPDYLLDLLLNIESTVLNIRKEFPSLLDKEVESVFEKLAAYYKLLSSGKEVEEPLTPSTKGQALIDEILNVLDEREEEALDEDLINNPDYLQGEFLIPSLNHLYVMTFKRLKKSVRNWRKKDGPKGYLQFIADYV